MGYRLHFDQLMGEIGSISWRLANWKHQLSFAANLCFQSQETTTLCDFTDPLAAVGRILLPLRF